MILVCLLVFLTTPPDWLFTPNYIVVFSELETSVKNAAAVEAADSSNALFWSAVPRSSAPTFKRSSAPTWPVCWA